ncbi:MAG: ABC transporter permease [Traorella sp.]
MKKRGLITISIFIILWIIFGEIVDNSIKLPSFFDVLFYMKDLMMSQKFYEAFGYTLFRSFFGLILALGFAILIGVISGLSNKFEEYFSPIYTILKSIPNISYILIVLIWTNSTFATCAISFMVMFPMAYANVLMGMKSIQQEYLDIMRVYPTSRYFQIIHVYLPLIRNYIFASLSNGIGLTFKVGIMAEIIGSVSPGLGRQFQLCRINVDMVGTFAWTIWLVLFLLGFETLMKKIKESYFK